MRCFRSVLDLLRRDKVMNEGMLKINNEPSVIDLLKQKRLRWGTFIVWIPLVYLGKFDETIKIKVDHIFLQICVIRD